MTRPLLSIRVKLPPLALSANNRNVHWSRRSQAMRTCIAEVQVACLESDVRKSLKAVKESLTPDTRFTLVCYGYPAWRGCSEDGRTCPNDDDNGAASCKGYRDGMAQELGIDDQRLRTHWVKKKHSKGQTIYHGRHRIPYVGATIIELHEAKEDYTQ